MFDKGDKMVFEQFVAKVCKQDARNKFAAGNNNLEFLPEFYHVYDPVDVEFCSQIGTVRMFSIAEIQTETENYAYLGLDFVFATINGDPLFVKNNAVYVCDHGSTTPTLEKISDSFEELLKSIV